MCTHWKEKKKLLSIIALGGEDSPLHPPVDETLPIPTPTILALASYTRTLTSPPPPPNRW